MTLREALDAFDSWGEARQVRARARLESWDEQAARREFSPDEFRVLSTLHEYNARLEPAPVG